MLNGVAPLLILKFTNAAATNAVKKLANSLNFTAEVSEFLQSSVGIPIPIYLDENLTGIYVKSESKAIDIATNVEAKDGKTKPLVDQRALNSVTTINMVANSKGVMLTTLLAFADLILTRVVSKQYSISYFNGPTIIIDGLLQGFTTDQGENDTLVRIQMHISKANNKGTADVGGAITLPAKIGASPVP